MFRKLIGAVVGLALAGTVTTATSTFAQEIEILSKAEALAVFSMSKKQWNTNIQHAVAAGAAKATGSADFGLGLATSGPDGTVLIVKPDYGVQTHKPDFIQVTIGYREPMAKLLNDDALDEVIMAAKSQMQPEYEIIGSYERLQGGLAVFFVITEKN